MVPAPPIRLGRFVAAETAHASLRLIVVVSAVIAFVLASAALPGASLGAGSAAVVLDMDPGAPGIQNTRSYPAGTTDIYVDVWVLNADAGGIGAFEFEIAIPFGLQYVEYTLGPFLGSTGRPVQCSQLPAIPEGRVRIGCATTGLTPPGPSGDGLLATLHFRPLPLAAGDFCIPFYLVETADVDGTPLPTSDQGGCVTLLPPTPTPTATHTPPATVTPTPSQTPPPTPSETPGRTATAGSTRTAVASATRTAPATRTALPTTGTPAPAVTSTVVPVTREPSATVAAATHRTSPTPCGAAPCREGVLSAPPVVSDNPSGGASTGGAAGASALPRTGGGPFQRMSTLELVIAFVGMVLVVWAIRITVLADDDK